MAIGYVLAALAAVVVAVWLQRATSMARGYAWLSRLGAALFALLLAPTLARNFNTATAAQAVVLTCLPLIAVPYQVRMMALIGRSKSSRPTTGDAHVRGPGGGRVRPRGRKQR